MTRETHDTNGRGARRLRWITGIELGGIFVAIMAAYFFLLIKVSPFIAAGFAFAIIIPLFTFMLGPVWGFMLYFPTTFVLAIRVPGVPMTMNQLAGIFFIIGWVGWWWRGRVRLAGSRYLWLLITAFIYFICSALLGEDPAAGLVAVKSLVIYFLLGLIIASMLTSRREVATFAWIILIATLGHALVGFAEYITGIDLLVTTRAKWMGSFRINAASPSAVVYGHYLLFAFPFGYYLFSESQTVTRRTMALLISLFILLVSILTMSRQVMIVLMLEIVLVPLFFTNRHSKKFALIVLVFALLSSPYVAHKVGQRLQTLQVERLQTDRSLIARTDSLKVGREIFRQKPVFGIGLGSFPTRWLNYVQYDTYALHLDRDPQMKMYTDFTYNQLLSETGLVGLGLALLIYLSIISISWRARARALRAGKRALANFSSIVLILILALIITNIVEDTLLAFRTWLIFGLALALQKPGLFSDETVVEAPEEEGTNG